MTFLAFIIFLLLFLCFNKSIRIYNKTIHFYSLLLVYFILCVAMQGGMYLFYYSYMNNLRIIALIFMYIIFYIDYNSKNDYTNQMVEFAEEFVCNLGDVDGFILKSKSPTCGIKDVKVYYHGNKCSIRNNGSGFFHKK